MGIRRKNKRRVITTRKYQRQAVRGKEQKGERERKNVTRDVETNWGSREKGNI